MFKLDVGRMEGGPAFSWFADNLRNADRIKATMSLDALTLCAFIEKLDEGDYNNAAADGDMDEYGVLALYKTETFEVGGLLAYLRDASTSSAYTLNRYILNPYAKAIVGPVTLVAEGQIDWGERDYEGSTTDTDVEALLFNLEASMDVGPANVMVGWAHADGDDPNDNDIVTQAHGGTEWEPFLILTTDDVDAAGLGGATNLNDSTQDWGFDLFYGKATFSPMENVTIYGILGFANADEERAYVDLATQDDDIGWEFDIGASITLMDNLVYKIVVGYFDSGDFWNKANTETQVDDSTYTVFNQLQVTF